MADYTFPDTVAGVIDVIGRNFPDVLVGKHLPSEYTDMLPAASARRLPSPGEPEPFLRSDRIVVDVYAKGSTEGELLGQAIRSVLAGTWHDTAVGLLDRVEIDTEPAEVPTGSDATTYISMTVRVDVRPVF